MRLLNALKTHAASMDASAPVGRWGIVNGANGAMVKVLLQPEGVQTDWLPLASSMVGGGWGMVHIPPNGTPVFCVPDAGDAENYVVIGATWSAANAPPAAAQGELWIVHSTGSSIKLTNDGKVTLADASGSSVAMQNSGTVAVTGNVTLAGTLAVTGAITVNGTILAVP